MRILLVNEYCIFAGVESLMAALSAQFRTRGHTCELFFFRRGPAEPELSRECALHFGDLADLLRLVRTGGFDVVHGNSADWELGLSAVHGTGVKLVLTGHGTVKPAWTSRNCAAWVGCAAWMARAQQAWTDLPVQTVLNGIDTRRFFPSAAPPSGPPIAAWVGRGGDLRQKRITTLAAIAPLLRDAGIRLWLADADGPDKVVPEAAAALRERAELWGTVSRDEMPGFFRTVAASGGCVLSTSSFEGLPMALLEAQACGCPVIATRVRGNDEAVHPEHGGELYPFSESPADLAQRVIRALSGPEEMRRRGTACAAHVRERFSLERMTEQYLELYENAPMPPLRGPRAWLARMRVAPQPSFRSYADHRWQAANRQYAASVSLARDGHLSLAAAAARAAAVNCPTLFTRPARLRHLLAVAGGAKARGVVTDPQRAPGEA